MIYKIIQVLIDKPLSLGEIAIRLGHKQLSGNIRKALPNMLKIGLIEYTIPNKPKSNRQKYRLTGRGFEVQKTLKEKKQE